MRRLLAIAGLGAITAIATVVVVVVSILTAGGPDAQFTVFLFAGLWLYWALGALIVVRGDGHVVGWLFAVAAAMMASVFGCFALGAILVTREPSNPLGPWVGLAGWLLFIPAAILILPAVALAFPTGRLPGPGWRWPVRVIAAMVAVRTLAVMARPGPMFPGGEPNADNPLTPLLPAVSPDGLEILRVLETTGSLSLPLGAALGVAAIVVRFRRSVGEERQQLKWFLAAMAPAAVLVPLAISGIASSVPLVDTLSLAMLPLIAASVAVAILRSRLYDIDRIISRTVSYAAITAVLVGVFAVAALSLGVVLSSFAEGQTIAVAGSTLLVAALFGPLRRRAQAIVDRRFDRTAYDASLTVQALTARLRDDVDLDRIETDVLGVVERTFHPACLGLWLR